MKPLNSTRRSRQLTKGRRRSEGREELRKPTEEAPRYRWTRVKYD
jgi:hypothetical protein